MLTGEKCSFSAKCREESVTRDPLVPVSLIKVQGSRVVFVPHEKEAAGQRAVNLHSCRVRELEERKRES